MRRLVAKTAIQLKHARPVRNPAIGSQRWNGKGKANGWVKALLQSRWNNPGQGNLEYWHTVVAKMTLEKDLGPHTIRHPAIQFACWILAPRHWLYKHFSSGLAAEVGRSPERRMSSFELSRCADASTSLHAAWRSPWQVRMIGDRQSFHPCGTPRVLYAFSAFCIE